MKIKKKEWKIIVGTIVFTMIFVLIIDLYGYIVNDISFNIVEFFIITGIILFFIYIVGIIIYGSIDYIKQIIDARGKWKLILILILVANIFRVLAQIRYSKK